MKKSLLALAVLGTFAGAASAQSSVTIWGVVDLSANSIKNGSTTTKQLSSSQLTTNRLGFRGVEDLGGGLKASFWLEAGMSNDDGTVGGSNGLTSVMFNRRSTVSLASNFGEIRAGRDYEPTFWNFIYFDVNGAAGLGQGFNLYSTLGTGLDAKASARANNTIGYLLPSGLGGVYGQIQVGAPEGVSGQKYQGGRLGYAAGPIDVAAAYGVTKIFGNSDYKVANFGASYDFGMAKIYGLYDRNTWGTAKQTVYELSVGVPVGAGEFRAVYGRSDLSGTANVVGGASIDANDSKLYSLGYVYNLSKRTALYTTYGRISNSGTAALVVQAAPGSAAGTTSTGYNFGLRHSF